MAIHTFLFRAIWMLALVVLAAGCADPESHPIVEPPPLRDGDALDLSATYIGANGGRPWIVNSDWNIEASRTVTIEAGTEIMFAGLYIYNEEGKPIDYIAYDVNVDGQIIANGQAGNKITFTSAYLVPDRGDWRSIKLRNSTVASEFKYCVFSHGANFEQDTSSEAFKYYRGMLAIRNSSPVIENCLVYHAQNNAVYIHADEGSAPPAPQIRYNIFTVNDGAAIRSSEWVDMSLVDVSYNCVGGNTIIPFLLAHTDSSYGYLTTQNLNLDSTDSHYNLLDNNPPELEDPANRNYTPTSCSPAVDAGPDWLTDPDDGTRRDLGPAPYHQIANELRGVKTGTLNAGATFRMSCHVRVPQGGELIIPAGTRIEATGLYNIEVFGRLVVQGTWDSRVVICNCLVPGFDVWGGLRFLNYDSLSAPSFIQYADVQFYDSMIVSKPGVIFDHVRFDGGYKLGATVTTGNLDPAASVNFLYCEFNHCGSYGILSEGSSVMIRNSIVQNVKGRGISLIGTGESVEITNTIVRACSTNGITAEDLSSPRIVNCVITDNGYHGLHLINNCNPPILNTIIWANHRIGIKTEQSSSPQLEYNNIAGNVDGDLQPPWLACANCVFANPLFTGASGVQLGAGSPSIDAGHPDPQYNDWNDGSRNDQGAYGGPAGQFIGPLGISQSNDAVVLR